MIYQFCSVRTPDRWNSEVVYFQSIRAVTERKLALPRVEAVELAQTVCEYLDCVDAGDLPMDRKLYRECLEVLGNYLSTSTSKEAAHLADRSWAAKTLINLIRGDHEESLRYLS